MWPSIFAGEQEFKSLSPKETELCQKACQDELLSVRQADYSVLQSLYKQGFVYLNVPVESNNYVSIPPLEVISCFSLTCSLDCTLKKIMDTE